MEDDQHQHQYEDDLPICPSFSSYSTNKFADIAANVVKEGSNLSVDEDSDIDFSFVCCDDDDDDDDDLSIVRGDGEFRQIFPIFNRDLSSDVSSINISLKKLFLDEDEEHDPTSSSSSEIDELETIPPESYCVWKPKEAEASPITCKKSRSTGSGSKRWKLRDLLYRSNSDGKSAFVFLREKSKSVKVEISDPIRRRKLPDGLKKQNQKTVSSPANNMLLYSRNRAMMKESERRKSYLPYRRDLVGFFTNVNGIGRNSHRY